MTAAQILTSEKESKYFVLHDGVELICRILHSQSSSEELLCQAMNALLNLTKLSQQCASLRLNSSVINSVLSLIEDHENTSVDEVTTIRYSKSARIEFSFACPYIF